MSLLKMFLVIMSVIAAQAVTTMAQETVPEPVPAPVPAPVPDPISTPGLPNVIGNIGTCALLGEEITGLEEQIAETRQTLIATDIHAPLFWPLARLLAQLEAELIMLQLEYAILCGGELPVTKECAKAAEEIQKILDKIQGINTHIRYLTDRLNELPPNDPGRALIQEQINKAQQELSDAYWDYKTFPWPEECGERPKRPHSASYSGM